MKSLRQFTAAVVLSLVFATHVFAGEMDTPYLPPPPPATTAGEMDTPTAVGEMDTPVTSDAMSTTDFVIYTLEESAISLLYFIV